MTEHKQSSLDLFILKPYSLLWISSCSQSEKPERFMHLNLRIIVVAFWYRTVTYPRSGMTFSTFLNAFKKWLDVHENVHSLRARLVFQKETVVVE